MAVVETVSYGGAIIAFDVIPPGPNNSSSACVFLLRSASHDTLCHLRLCVHFIQRRSPFKEEEKHFEERKPEFKCRQSQVPLTEGGKLRKGSANNIETPPGQ